MAGDVTGTAVLDVDLDLGADGRTDRVVSLGDDTAQFVTILGGTTGVFVLGMPAFLQIHGAEPGDALELHTRGGDDHVDGTAPMRVLVDGGAGDDALAGGAGAETFLGRSGDDHVDGNGGDDAAFLGTGDDIFRWDPGDGSDHVDGHSGHDVLLFLGSAADERFDVVADRGRVRFRRDVGSIAMRLDGIEKTDTLAQGGADTVAIGDLSGTDLDLVETNLSGIPGGPASDGVTDRVLVTGTSRADALVVRGAGGTVDLTGLPAAVRTTRSEPLDELVVDGGAGADTLDDSGLAPGTIGLAFSD